MAKNKKQNLITGWHIVGKYLRPHKKTLLFLAFLSVISALLEAAVPYLAGRVVDFIITPTDMNIPYFGNTRIVFALLFIWIVVRLLNDIIDWDLRQTIPMLSARMEAEYLASSYAKLIELPLSFHKSHKMGEISNRIARAGSWLDNLVNVIIRILPQFLSIIFALTFSIYIQPILALVLVLGVALYILILVPVLPKIAKISRMSHAAYSEAFGDAYDAVLNVSSVKQATAENHERRNLYRNFVFRAYKKWLQMRSLWGIINISQSILITIVSFVIFIVGIKFIADSRITVGELLMFNGYAAMFFGPFLQIGHNWEAIQNGVITLERAEKVLTTDPEIYIPNNIIIPDSLSGEIKFENVTFSYGKKQKNILRDLSFHIKAGEKIALVGESGVGKSTLIDLLSYYYAPTTGKVFIDGHNIDKYDLNFLRSQIAVVPQEIILFNDSVKNNIRYGSFGATDEKVKEASRQAHADEFIEGFPKKYNQIVGERGIKLSMGQKQRIAIARAILRDPKILILDEPTSALDAKSEKFIQASFKELMQERTTFIIAHRLSTVREVDRIFVLEKGRIVEEGTHNELVQKDGGIYQKLYSLQIGLS
ncbi:MAG: ABC transporter ATP-binding protein [Patescibacteria group bacterium]|mgnify:CR=1 FL=1